MIIVYYIGGDLKILFTEIRRYLNFPYSKVRKRLTKRILVSYSWRFYSLPNRYLGRELTEETVRFVEEVEIGRHDKIGYLYSL